MAMDMEMDLGVPVRTPDSDTDTPPRNPPMKRHHHSNSPYAPGVSYKECMKNHAASIGAHALDGCCEFMPGPTFNPLDPTSLKCAACGCHRNFHRRDPDDPTPLNHHPTPARRVHSPPSASQLLLSLSQSSGPSDEANPTTAINMGSGGGRVSGGGVLVGYAPGGGQNGNFTCGSSNSSKKRFRTKFTQEQKERMYEFSEKIGWRLKKGEERLVEDFVKEIGVGRSVFKVWMHNNKHTSSSGGKRETNNSNSSNNNNKDLQQQTHLVVSSVIGGSTTSPTTLNYVAQQQQKQQQQQHSASNVGAGNCGASVVVVDQHHHHHRQFNFANGGGQETQAQ